MENALKVVGARGNNLKNITVEIPRDKFTVMAYPGPGNPRWRLTRFLPKDSGVMSNHFPLMPGSSLVRWINPTWT